MWQSHTSTSPPNDDRYAGQSLSVFHLSAACHSGQGWCSLMCTSKTISDRYLRLASLLRNAHKSQGLTYKTSHSRLVEKLAQYAQINRSLKTLGLRRTASIRVSLLSCILHRFHAINEILLSTAFISGNREAQIVSRFVVINCKWVRTPSSFLITWTDTWASGSYEKTCGQYHRHQRFQRHTWCTSFNRWSVQCAPHPYRIRLLVCIPKFIFFIAVNTIKETALNRNRSKF